jgi:murein DD-endopeptidase MepM/ murein hydrolase activator NlpD
VRGTLYAVLLCTGALQAQSIPPLPDSSGWGVHVLAIERGPDGALWVGTYGRGIYVLRQGAGSWEQIRSSADTAARAISWDFVHAFGFGPRGQVWYGTVGNGWGLSSDGGKTWRNWGFSELGPEWQYVTPDGILTRGDTTYIATADGIKVTWDDGQTWRVITDSAGATTARDSVWSRIANQYLFHLRENIATPGELSIWYPSGAALSSDGGRTWRHARRPARLDMERLRAAMVPRSFHLCSDSSVKIRAITALGAVALGTPFGLLSGAPGERLDCLALPGAAPSGSPAGPREIRAPWFRRPIALGDQPYIDQTYRYGSTMGGNFQPHQGIEFNNGNGTLVYAIGDGEVVHAGPAERGALTVAIKHDQRLGTRGGQRLFVYSVYYHNSQILVPVGRRVRAGDRIARVGNTGRATNDHMHLEIHAAPVDSTRLIVDPDVRFPPYTLNPELFIDPLPGTGMVVGQVWDSSGQAVPQARIYGLVKPEPRETPFSFIETYGPRNHSDPNFNEHFAITDVPPGLYIMGVEIGGTRVFRRVLVQVGKTTWVEFTP